jgi:signal recognition particle receptor subunit beta
MIIDSKKPKSNNEKENDIDVIDFNQFDGIIQFKIVYWGPGESGKTTNFMRLREKYHYTKLTDGYSVETTDGRTLWQDSVFLSFNLNLKRSKFNIIAQIVTCTGQERFLATREYVLDGADGILFVGDSDPEKLEQNKRSFRELISFAGPMNIPYVVQLNKRDLKDAISIEEFKKQLGLPLVEEYPDGTLVVYPTKASIGENVIRCFQDLMLQVIICYFSS